MHIVKIDTQNNRLYLTLSGVISVPEAMKIRDEIYKGVESLKPGFDVINDLSKYIHADEKGAQHLQEVTRFFIEKNVGRIVRVVGQSKTGLMQFAKYSQLIETINIKYVPTMEEAEAFIAAPSDENKE